LKSETCSQKGEGRLLYNHMLGAVMKIRYICYWFLWLESKQYRCTQYVWNS